MSPPTAAAPTSAPAPALAKAVARGSPWWAAWADLIRFRPSAAVQNGVKSRSSSWYIHKLEDAWGDINIDLYPVVVSSLPPSVSAEDLLEHIRTNINDFVDPSYSHFYPYDERYPPPSFGDKARWLSSGPESAVISISMRMVRTWPGSDPTYYFRPDRGSVVCAQHEPNFWIFSTIYTDEDWGHPVSGNRQFGFIQDPNNGSFIFFTRGADRATSMIDDFPLTPVFTFADWLWKSFQQRLVNYVNGNGGSASSSSPISERVFWPAVKVVAWHPTVQWI